MTGSPLGLFAPAGIEAGQTAGVLWGLIWLSVVVVVLIAAAVLAGIMLRSRHAAGDARTVIVPRRGDGLWWIYGGVGISTLVLFAFIGWTLATMAGVASPAKPAAFVVDVNAEQWWWQFNYEPSGTSPAFTVANELHIPVGQPVRFRVTSLDVIHSFWVPALGGKTDAIPGRVNDTWLEADKPGTYYGQCSEYCGQQHAEMALRVIAEPQAQFDAWRAAQSTDARAGNSIGETQFVLNCGECHTVRGTAARGDSAPDLTHLMSRQTIAAGMLANTMGNLSGWIADPQGIKPGSKMPDIPLSGQQLQAVLAYLQTLT